MHSIQIFIYVLKHISVFFTLMRERACADAYAQVAVLL